MKRICIFLGAIVLLVSCTNKKMIVLSKGPADVNTDNKTIKSGDGSGHEEKEVTIGSSKAVYKLTTPAGEASVDLAGDGLFIVNAKNDTIIGGYQKYGDPRLSQNVVTQERLKQQIDSVKLLSEGKNANAANRTFYILPNTAVKISDNIQSMVVGPYHRMRSAEKVDGKDPEVYRFYSIKEIREMLAKWEEMTVAEKK